MQCYRNRWHSVRRLTILVLLMAFLKAAISTVVKMFSWIKEPTALTAYSSLGDGVMKTEKLAFDC